MKNSLLFVILSLSFFHCAKKSVPAASMSSAPTLPAAIQQKIDSIKSRPVENPPTSVYQYDYNGQKVYYFSAPCCDRFSNLLNVKGELICHPDGGFTGRGDNKCKDFADKKTNEVLIWKDERGAKNEK